MARYDEQGYRRDGRRQILGYSRAVQGGADAARARANARVYDAQDHLYEGEGSLTRANQRARRVAAAKESGAFDGIREAYNNPQRETQMDEAGNIVRGVNVGAPKTGKYIEMTSPRMGAKMERPMTIPYRPYGQRVNDIVDTTSPTGLMSMAQRARRKGTLVIR